MKKFFTSGFIVSVVLALVMFVPGYVMANTQPVDGTKVATNVVKMTEAAQTQIAMTTAQTVTTDQMATQTQSLTILAQTIPIPSTDRPASQVQAHTASNLEFRFNATTTATGVDRGTAPINASNGDVSDQAALNTKDEQRAEVLKTCTQVVSVNNTNQDETTQAIAWGHNSEIERGQAPTSAIIVCMQGADGEAAYDAALAGESTPKPNVATTFEKETTGNALKTCTMRIIIKTGADATPAFNDATATNADEDGATNPRIALTADAALLT